MTLPNFLIIGAGRTGTTSLYRQLGQHPQVFVSPVKEPRFFAYEGRRSRLSGGPFGSIRLRGHSTDLGEYKALFAGATGEPAVGEASVDYLYLPQSAERIRHHIPGARLVAIVRQPVARAYSQFWARVAMGAEPVHDFVEALCLEARRIEQGWPPQYHYRQKSLYCRPLSRYFELFPRDQIKILLHEELDLDPIRMFREVALFLGVDDSFVPDVSRRYNLPRGLPRGGWLRAALARPRPVKGVLRPLVPASLRRRLRRACLPSSFAPRPPLDRELKRRLTRDFEDDILGLERLLGRDLSAWLD